MDEKTLREILSELGIEHTKPRMRDSLDFYDIHITGLVRAIEEAYCRGHDDGMEEAINSMNE